MLRYSKESADKIIREHKKFFNRNYKKIKTGKNEYKLVEGVL